MPRAVPGRSATPRAQPISHSEAPRGLPRIPCRLCPEPRGPVQAERGSGWRARKAEGTGCPRQPPLTEQACPPSHLLSGKTGGCRQDLPKWAAADLDQVGPGDIGTRSDCGWTGGHSLVAGEVFGNSSSGGCTGPDLHSPQDFISYGRVQPLPHTQADRHTWTHRPHTDTHL